MKEPDSTILYRKTLDSIMNHLSNTQSAVTDQNKEKAVRILRESRRIFFAGSGSSIPAALFAGRLLSERYGFCSQFVTTSQLVGEDKLGDNDTVVLVSQGWNRSDALLVTDHILKSKAKLIGLTGNAQSPYPQQSNVLFSFFPPYKDERLFCRPSSVITGYILVADLATALGNEKFLYGKAETAIVKGLQQGKKTTLPDATRYIVLSSGLGLAGATNTCLALREGAGLSASVYEIESFGHGWYVPDQIFQKEGGKVHYIIATHKNDARCRFAVKRILPLLKKTHSSYDIWTSSFDVLYGNIQILARTAQTVLNLISQSGYDMNNPPGKEENRYFHDLLLPGTK